jgi:hypothetical protein
MMNASAYVDNHPDPVMMIAACLTDQFVQSLYNLQRNKGYCVYLGCLGEIFDWATEFYSEYYYKLNHWTSFEKSKDNIYQASNQYGFLIAWGKNRIELLAMQQ